MRQPNFCIFNSGQNIFCPTNINTKVELVGDPLLSFYHYLLYDAFGKQVRKGIVEKGKQYYRVNLSSIPYGLYYWKMKNKNGRVRSGKVVVLE